MLHLNELYFTVFNQPFHIFARTDLYLLRFSDHTAKPVTSHQLHLIENVLLASFFSHNVRDTWVVRKKSPELILQYYWILCKLFTIWQITKLLCPTLSNWHSFKADFKIPKIHSFKALKRHRIHRPPGCFMTNRRCAESIGVGLQTALEDLTKYVANWTAILFL